MITSIVTLGHMSSAVELGVPLMDNRKDHQKESQLQQSNSGSNSLQTYKFCRFLS
jgi:hypothetical protein